MREVNVNMEILRDTNNNEAVIRILEFRLLLKVTCTPLPGVPQNEVLGQRQFHTLLLVYNKMK